MKGNELVIQHLNALLTGELTAADQYLAHSRLYQDWGYNKLYERLAHESAEELQHADALIQRILFLEGTPNIADREPLLVGTTVVQALANDLEYEYKVGAGLRAAIAVCEQAADYQSREILEVLLKDTEEDHTYWLEKQLRLIESLGLANYLQSQM